VVFCTPINVQHFNLSPKGGDVGLNPFPMPIQAQPVAPSRGVPPGVTPWGASAGVNPSYPCFRAKGPFEANADAVAPSSMQFAGTATSTNESRRLLVREAGFAPWSIRPTGPDWRSGPWQTAR
jgi:hypothetical protein